MSKRVLITGITGQDAYYLAQQCLADGEIVYGLARWSSDRRKRMQVAAEMPALRLIDGDLQDAESLRRAITEARPDVVYNLAALASSGQSWVQPMAMGEINALGPLRLLEAIHQLRPEARFVQASTSEQYGRVNEMPQSERTPFGSLNVYGIAKTFAHQATINYRDSYKLHASTALMHNHVSYRRNPYFVDRKITRAVARIAAGLDNELLLGNTEARRDWGWAPEYMQAWRLIAEQDDPGDYVLCTGESHSVREFIEAAFAAAGLDAERYVRTDPALFRPTDVLELRGDPRHAAKALGWSAGTRFAKIVERMVKFDVDELARDL